MKLEYEGYILIIEEVDKDCYRTYCNELPYYLGGLHNICYLDTIIKVFKNEVKRTKKKEAKLQEIDKEIKALLEKQAYLNSPNARLEIEHELVQKNQKSKPMTDKTKTEQIHQYYLSRLERLAFEESSEYRMSTNHLEVELKNIHKFFHTLLDLTEKDVKEDYCVLASKKKNSFTQSLIPSS